MSHRSSHEEENWFETAPLGALTDNELIQIMDAGRQAGLKLYRFKQKEDLPRVSAVLGFLRGVRPQSLLDVGSGRGTFLFPFFREFPETPVTAADLLPHRVELLSAVAEGGVDCLTALQQDICTWDAPDGSFDVVTLLEVLEHIPQVDRAVEAAVRLARRYVVDRLKFVRASFSQTVDASQTHGLDRPIVPNRFRRPTQALFLPGGSG